MAISQVWSFYIVRCRDGSLYSGITNNLESRLSEHNKGTGAKYTFSRRPVSLAYSERYDNISKALKREAQVKSWSKNKKERLIVNSGLNPMNPRIEIKPEMKFVGRKMKMSLIDNYIPELWKQFMLGKKKIKNSVGIELYSIDIFPRAYFEDFNPTNNFEKWAAVEVSDFDSVPRDMGSFISPEGFYAVFSYKGPAGEAPKTYQNILQKWLPNSGYLLDARPHVWVMGEKYDNNDPDSEEELWIPVKKSNLTEVEENCPL